MADRLSMGSWYVAVQQEGERTSWSLVVRGKLLREVGGEGQGECVYCVPDNTIIPAT